MVEYLKNPTDEELDALTLLWEASVRASHGFLSSEEIDFYRPLVRSEALPAAELYVIRKSDGQFAAFMGIDGDKIEMLFVAPDLRGRGLGRTLAEDAIKRHKVRRVDVNEENAAAGKFYARLGFRMLSRDERDPSGRPHPILHLGL